MTSLRTRLPLGKRVTGDEQYEGSEHFQLPISNCREGEAEFG